MFSSMLFHFSMFLLLINSSIQMMFESNIGKTLNHINGSLNLIANLIKNSENQMLRQIDVMIQASPNENRTLTECMCYNLIVICGLSKETFRCQKPSICNRVKLGTLKTCLNTEYERINRSLNLIANLIKNSENQLQRQIDHSKLGTLKTCLNTEYERINKTESENSVKRCNSLVSVRLKGNVHLILTIFNIHTSPALLIGLRKQSTLILTSNVFYTMILIKNI
ncbi:hypothetical protein KSF78_0008516 [Schistosoma japonicum]|nr:hypothetical protein KSF78_0008516 [Schistosoma japonicum]